jgi:predicted metalloprotease
VYLDLDFYQQLADEFEQGDVAAALRVSWFRRGLDGGSIADCDTFSARS